MHTVHLPIRVSLLAALLNMRLYSATSPPSCVRVCADVNFEELSRSTEDFNGAMLKAVCVEAGMIALRREGVIIKHEDFVDGIQAVQMKKKTEVQYYA